jgi:hypothetical protein
MYKKIPDRAELQARAAILVAEDELSDTEIAHLCGITRRTLVRWKERSAIQQKVDEHLRLSKQESERQMIVERQMRIADLEERRQKLEDIIHARANSLEMKRFPGGSTGLVIRRKGSFRQRDGRLAEYDYELDIPLLREMRRLEVAAAKALGQWQRPKYQPIAFSTSTELPSAKKHRAALLIADGMKSDLEIASACRINRRTLIRWKEQPSFHARVASVRTTLFGDIL